MWLKRILFLCCAISTTVAIYLPNDNVDKKSQNSAGIKTLDWQGGDSQSSVTVHHNYSKVYHTNYPNGTGVYSQTHNETQYRQPKGNVQHETFSERNSSPYFVDQHQDFHQQTQNFDQQAQNFDQHSQSFDQHSQSFDQQSQSFDQQSQSFDQQAFEDTTRYVDHKPSSSDQVPQYSLPDSRPININNQLRGFGQQTINDHIEFSGTKPEKLQFQNKDTAWKIQVYKTCPKGETGQFVYEYSCSQFLNCWKGRGHVQNCGPGTLFNPKTLECDYPEKVSCVTGQTQAIMEANKPLSAALQASCPQGFTGMIPHYTVCSKFIQCANGQEIQMDCPPGTMFDIKTNMCDFPYKADCASGGQSDSQSTNNNQQHHSGYSKKFVVIKPYKRNVTYEFQSGINNQLGGFTGTDSHGKTYYISGTNVQQAGQQSQVNDHLGDFSQQGSSTFGREGRQDTFGQRQTSQQPGHGGQTYLGQQTGQSTHYLNGQNSQFGYHSGSSQINQNQQWSGQNIHGQAQNSHGQAQNIHGQGQNIQSASQHRGQYFMIMSEAEMLSMGFEGDMCKNKVGVFEHPSNCSIFLYCENNRLYQGICTDGTSYNPSKNICEYYHCQKSSNQQRNFPGEAKCPEGASGLYPHPRICEKFLNCDHGITHIQDCGPGTVFNPTYKVCDFPYNVKCSNQPDRTGKLVSSTSTSSVSQNTEVSRFFGVDEQFCSTREGFYQDMKNCSRFFNCRHGVLSMGICHPGAHYNPTTNNCDNNFKCHLIGAGQTGQNSYGQGQTWQGQNQGSYHQQTGANSQNQHSGQWSNGQNSYGHGQSGHGQNQGSYHQQTGGSSQNQNTGQWSSGQNSYGQGQSGHGQYQGTYHQQSGANSQNGNTGQWQNGHLNDVSQFKCSADGLFPHPSDCSKYMQCANGKFIAMSCGPGTLFNPITKVCDFPQNVRCGPGISYQDGQSGQVSYHQQGGHSSQIAGQRPIGQNAYGQGQTGQGQNQGFNNQQTGGSSQHQNTGRWQSGQNHQQSGYNPQNQHNGQWQGQNYHGQSSASQTTSSNRDTEFGESNIEQNFVNVDQVSKWTPSVQKTDTNADYVFEYEDIVEVDDMEDENKCDFKCSDHKCIKKSALCDGIVDCSNGDDEKNCEKYVRQFQLTKNTKMAVREKNKFPNTTLTFCAKQCLEADGFKCKAFNYRKNDGMCFILDKNVGQIGSLFTLPNYDYYEYKKFAMDCTNKFVCGNFKCIEKEQVCNGVFDCVDREDEKNCKPEKIGYQIQLVGAESSYKGAIQVTAFGKTGYVCDDQFGLRDAHVVCKELGFELGALEVKGNSYFSAETTDNNTLYMMDDVNCFGNETSLKDCDFSGWGVHNCKPKEVVGVVCKTPQEICSKDFWKCETGSECIPLTFMCDGVYDCTDKSDEATQHCESPIEIRLSGGPRAAEGRLEIKYHGTWGTICDDDFNDDAAKVACRYLGYKGPAHVKKDGYYGPGKGPIWLDQVFCQGNETTLQECDHWDWGKHNCEHDEDVGIACDDYNIGGTPRHTKLPNQAALLSRNAFAGRCGYRNDDIFLENSDVHFRVVQGSLAQKGHYPWQASIRVKGQTEHAHWCGAVVISEKFVLTAAHCLHDYTKGRFVVVAGDYHRKDEEGTKQVVNIDEFYLHEDFRKGTKMNNDIALVKLKGAGFNLTKDIQPICLPPANFNGEEGLNCTISGFGSIQSGKAVASQELRAGWVPIQPREVCTMPHVYGESITDGMICAGSLDEGIDACDGDSGGPLACLKDGLFTLIGVISWGQHCGYANKPGVYVKIAHYRDWIDHTMNKHA